MNTMLAKSIILLAAVSSALAVTVNTPMQITACQPILLSWADGTAPFYPSIIPGGNPSGTPLKQFPETSATSLTWSVDLAAGTLITVAVTDATGEVNYSDQVTIRAGAGECDLSAAGDVAAAPGGATTTAASGPTTTTRAAAAPGAASSSVRPVNAAVSGASSAASSGASAARASTQADSSAQSIGIGAVAVLAGLVALA